MKPDPILSELWKVKDDLAAEAGYDTEIFFQRLRDWETDSLSAHRLIRTADELCQIRAEQESERKGAFPLTLKDEPPHS